MATCVLIVDDDPFLRMLERKLLEGAGFSVQEVATGGAAAPAASLHLPHLALVDYHLPDLEGPDVIRALRGLVGLEALPVLLVTGSDDPARQAEALSAGASGVVTKATLVRDLLPTIRRTLGRSS